MIQQMRPCVPKGYITIHEKKKLLNTRRKKKETEDSNEKKKSGLQGIS